MATVKLTKKFVDGLQPSDKDESYFDTELKGFHVKVTPTGKKVFRVKGILQGKQKAVTLGTYPALTVDQARDRARMELGKLAQGVDPTEVKAKAKIESITLHKAFEEFKATRPLTPKTLRDYERSMRLLNWGETGWYKITGDMVIRKHQALTEENGPATANLAMRFLRSLLTFCIGRYRDINDKPLVSENPVKRISEIKGWNVIKRRTNCLKPHELKLWWEALDKWNGEQTTRDYIHFVLLTGLRREEAAAKLKWENIDFIGKTFTILDPKNHLDLTLPLSDYLLAMLERRRASRINEYVFHSTRSKSGHLEEPRKGYEGAERITGLHITIHDLRRTFLTIAESLDIPAYALKALVNHKSGNDVTAGYIQVTADRLRDPMQRITDFVLKQVGEKAPAQVIDFPTNKISNL